MEIKAEDFPLYGVIQKSPNPGSITARRFFEKAVTGNDQDKYDFALGMLTISRYTVDEIPGNTLDVQLKTVEKCAEIFNELADKGHPFAKIVSKQVALELKQLKP